MRYEHDKLATLAAAADTSRSARGAWLGVSWQAIAQGELKRSNDTRSAYWYRREMLSAKKCARLSAAIGLAAPARALVRRHVGATAAILYYCNRRLARIRGGHLLLALQLAMKRKCGAAYGGIAPPSLWRWRRASAALFIMSRPWPLEAKPNLFIQR